jgi:hypothetical protein
MFSLSFARSDVKSIGLIAENFNVNTLLYSSAVYTQPGPRDILGFLRCKIPYWNTGARALFGIALSFCQKSPYTFPHLQFKLGVRLLNVPQYLLSEHLSVSLPVQDTRTTVVFNFLSLRPVSFLSSLICSLCNS